MRLTPIALVIVAVALPASAQQQTYIVNGPQDLDKVPCEAWSRQPDGSVRLVAANIVVPSEHTILRSGSGFTSSTVEAQIIIQRCFSKN